MIDKIIDSLNKELFVLDGIKINGYTLLARAVVYFISTSWVFFYPIYLLVVYMWVEGFFSYDMFSDGVFGVNAFMILVFLTIIFSSFCLWGFIIFFAKGIKKRFKYDVALCIFFLVLSIIFHLAIVHSACLSGNWTRAIWLTVLAFVFSIFLSSYIISPAKMIISNWIMPISGIVLSAIIPISFSDTTSDVVKAGLQGFRMGGNVPVSTHNIVDKEMILSGDLVLLTPDFSYVRVGCEISILPRASNVYINIGEK